MVSVCCPLAQEALEWRCRYASETPSRRSSSVSHRRKFSFYSLMIPANRSDVLGGDMAGYARAGADTVGGGFGMGCESRCDCYLQQLTRCGSVNRFQSRRSRWTDPGRGDTE